MLGFHFLLIEMSIKNMSFKSSTNLAYNAIYSLHTERETMIRDFINIVWSEHKMIATSSNELMSMRRLLHTVNTYREKLLRKGFLEDLIS